MAARKRNWTPDVVRERIRTSMLINRLEKHAEGKLKLSPTQVRAIEVLLRKCVPDLSHTEHSGETTHHYVAEMPAKSSSTDEWLQQHAPSSGGPNQAPRLPS